jgi:hypothetical protein
MHVIEGAQDQDDCVGCRFLACLATLAEGAAILGPYTVRAH